MVKFKEIKRMVKREKGWILREFDYFKDLRRAVNKSNETESKRWVRKLGKIERRAFKSKNDLFTKMDVLKEYVFEEHQPTLETIKRKIGIFMDVVLKRISLVQGRIPDLLKVNPIPWEELKNEVETCITKGIDPLSLLFENLQKFIDYVETEITQKINVILTMKLNHSDKVVVLLVLFGRKPAGMITLNPEVYGEKYGVTKKKDLYFIHAKGDINLDRKDIAEFRNLLNELGLSHYYQSELHDVYNKENKIIKMERINFWIGKDRFRLQALLEAKGDVQIGRALGYPKTAVSKLNTLNTPEYLQMLRKRYTHKNVPEEWLYMIFTPKFSEKGIYEDNISWGRTNMKLVKMIAPDLHKEFISERKKVFFQIGYR